MALISLKQTGNSELKSENGRKRMYTRTYVGLSDDPTDDNLIIRNDPLCPKELDSDPFDPLAVIVAVQCKRRTAKSFKIWDITITSTTEFDTTLLERPSPLDRAASWESETVLYERPILKDIKGNLITNTAGDLFEGAKEYAVGWTFHATKNIAPVPLDWVDDFVNAVNDAPVTIDGKRCDTKTVWFRSARISSIRQQAGVRYRPGSFVFEYNPAGWWFEPLNRGYRELEERQQPVASAPGTFETVRRLVEIVDDKGRPVSSPQFLDRDGRVYRVNDPTSGKLVRKIPLEPSDVITLRFEVKKPVSFRRLNVL
jgi:hypothetical protein